jgi:transposase-like protein
MNTRKSRRVEVEGQEPAEEGRSTVGELGRATLFSFLIESGIGKLEDLLEAERTAECGRRYEHQLDRRAYRYGHAPGELVLGGRRVRVKRPRARTLDGCEVLLPSWKHFSKEDPLEARALEQMVVGVSTRKYHRSLEEVPPGVEVRGTSKSAVSRRFVAATQEQLGAFLARPLDGIDLVVLMIDGVHFADHVILVAIGIDENGEKHVLGTWEGATENAASCEGLLGNLVGRGLDAGRPMLVVIDGSKALAKAVRQTFGRRTKIQRCQVHKKRNVLEHLPDKLRRSLGAKITAAYQCGDPDQARRILHQLARQLEESHPGAAASLREGLDETLTVMAFELPRALERTLSSTNVIENFMGTARRVSRNVKRWRGGTMMLRWIVAAAIEAKKSFRRVRGHKGIAKLVHALNDGERTPSEANIARSEAA